MPLFNPNVDVSYPLSGLTLDVPSTNCLAKLVALGAITTIDPYATLVAKLDSVGVKVYASFDMADSALTLGNADTGQAWTSIAGTWGIDGNKAYLVSALGEAAIATESLLSDCSITATMATINDRARLAFRCVDINNLFILDAKNVTSTFYRLFRRVAGVSTVIATGTIPYSSGQEVEIRLEGSSIKVYVNGVLDINVVDANHQTATKHGLAGYTDSYLSRYDNFIVEVL